MYITPDTRISTSGLALGHDAEVYDEAGHLRVLPAGTTLSLHTYWDEIDEDSEGGTPLRFRIALVPSHQNGRNEAELEFEPIDSSYVSSQADACDADGQTTGTLVRIHAAALVACLSSDEAAIRTAAIKASWGDYTPTA